MANFRASADFNLCWLMPTEGKTTNRVAQVIFIANFIVFVIFPLLHHSSGIRSQGVFGGAGHDLVQEQNVVFSSCLTKDP